MELFGNFGVELAQYFLEEGLMNENGIGKFATIVNGVVTGDDINLIVSQGYEMGVAAASCNPTYKNISPFKGKKWDINNVEVNIELCENAWKKEMLRGTAPMSYDSPELMEIVKKLTTDALAKSQFLNAFFGDKANASQTNASLKASNGWLTRLDTIVTNDASRRTTISTNTRSALRTGMTAVNILDDLCDEAANKLASSEMEIIVNRTLWNAVLHNLRTNAGTHVEKAYTELFMGIKQTDWDGVPVFVVPSIDECQGVTSAPHASDAGMAIATTKQNMVLGMRETDQLANVSFEIDKVKKKLFVPSTYSIDAQFVDDELVQFAY